MGESNAPSHLTLSEVGKSKSRSLRLQSLISHRGVELGHMLLLTIIKKPCMGNPIISHLTLSDPVRSKSRSLRF